MHVKPFYLKIFFALFFIVLLNGCSSIGAAMRASPSLANSIGLADIPLNQLKKEYTNSTSHWIDVDGLNIHYEDVGQGPVIVLVHGIMSSLQTWDDWTDTLKNNYRVIRLDVPGFGLTGGPKDINQYNEAYLMKTFTQFIDDLDLKKFILVGNSLGGYIAAKYTAFHNSRVNKLILIDPVGYPQSIPLVMKIATAPVMSLIAKHFQPPVLIAMNVKDVYGDPRRLTKKNLDRYIQMAQRPGATEYYYKIMEILKKRSTSKQSLPFAAIAVPTLIMWGGKDPWVPVKISNRWLKSIQGSKRVIYPTAGHIPMEEIPQKTLKDALAFINNEPLPSLQSASKEKTKKSGNTDSSSGFDTISPGAVPATQ